MFAAFAIRVLQASANLSRAASLLGLSWDTAHVLMTSAVERHLECRETDNVKHVGIDEKSFGSGHSYVSVLTDTDQSGVPEVDRDRTMATCEEL